MSKMRKEYDPNKVKRRNGRLITGFACDSRTVDAEFLLATRQCIAATGRVQGRYAYENLR
mgnify:CR=1 FL=1